MSIGIYKITSPSGKVYIGQSINIEKRWKKYSIHKKVSQQQSKLHYSFRKYGKENHTFEIIEECSIEQLNEREIYWINKYNSVKKGLNISIGGYNFGEINLGKKHSPETINKMKEWWRLNKKPRSQETINKIKNTKKENPQIMDYNRIKNHINNSPLKKPIYQLDLEDNIIQEFSSINEAARDLNIRNDGISACLRGKQKTAYGYKWKYK